MPNGDTSAGGFRIDGGTYMFMIPSTENLRGEEENLNVLNGPNGLFSNNTAYTVTAFDMTESGTASVVLYLTNEMLGTSSVGRNKAAVCQCG